MPSELRKAEAKKIKNMIRVGHLAAGAIAGELAMLGISQTRSASIQAATLCVFWEVTQERAMIILDRFPEEFRPEKRENPKKKHGGNNRQ